MLKKGYILVTVLLFITLLSTAFSTVLLYVTYNFNRVNKNIVFIKNTEKLFSTLEKVKEDIALYKDDSYTSSCGGWIPKLTGYDCSVDIVPEDSKIALNLIDRNALKVFLKDSKIDVDITKTIWDTGIIDATPDIEKIFSIYKVPNYNVSDEKMILEYYKLLPYVTHNPEFITDRIKSYRTRESYLKTDKLIIGSDEFEFFRSYFPRGKEDFQALCADYMGEVNLNYVEEKVFFFYYGLVSPEKDSQAQYYWDKILSYRNANKSITEITAIFNQDNGRFKKVFGLDSKLFKVSIGYGKLRLVSIVRVYKDRKGNNSTFVFTNKVWEEKYERKKNIDIQ